MEEFSTYTLCDPNYFDTISRIPTNSLYVDALRSVLSTNWDLTRFDIWLRCNRRGATLEVQGFKIHVSASLANAETVIRRVASECAKAGLVFKVAAAPLLHKLLNSKRYPRGGAGKFITIYPPDTPAFLDAIRSIHAVTEGFEGPYILSDMRYPGSKCVFYRYGGFQSIQRLMVDGTRRNMIPQPDGGLVPDERLPYFQLPPWVEDPLSGQLPEEDSGPLNGRYDVTEALSFTNTGGVYRAIDRQSGMHVVIKEARPNTEAWMGIDFSVDAVTALLRERDMLAQLQGLPVVPTLVDLFGEWEHLFLVTSYFDGIPLNKLRAADDFILMSYMDEAQRVTSFCRSFKQIAQQLLEGLERVHDRGIFLGDLSPGNVLVNTDSEELMLIDFESAISRSTDTGMETFASQWFNAGFRRPDRKSLRIIEDFDDYYSLGMLLYNIVCPVQNLFELNCPDPFAVLSHFTEAGVPPQVEMIIRALAEGRSIDARRELVLWDL